MSGKQVIIADGHHRYEVARLFSQEISGKTAVNACWDLYRYKLMSFVRLESEGITIFPIHRLLHSLKGFDAAAFLRRMNEHFVLKNILLQPLTSSRRSTF